MLSDPISGGSSNGGVAIGHTFEYTLKQYDDFSADATELLRDALKKPTRHAEKLTCGEPDLVTAKEPARPGRKNNSIGRG